MPPVHTKAPYIGGRHGRRRMPPAEASASFCWDVADFQLPVLSEAWVTGAKPVLASGAAADGNLEGPPTTPAMSAIAPMWSMPEVVKIPGRGCSWSSRASPQFRSPTSSLSILNRPANSSAVSALSLLVPLRRSFSAEHHPWFRSCGGIPRQNLISAITIFGVRLPLDSSRSAAAGVQVGTGVLKGCVSGRVLPSQTVMHASSAPRFLIPVKIPSQ